MLLAPKRGAKEPAYPPQLELVGVHFGSGDVDGLFWRKFDLVFTYIAGLHFSKSGFFLVPDFCLFILRYLHDTKVTEPTGQACS